MEAIRATQGEKKKDKARLEITDCHLCQFFKDERRILNLKDFFGGIFVVITVNVTYFLFKLPGREKKDRLVYASLYRNRCKGSS